MEKAGIRPRVSLYSYEIMVDLFKLEIAKRAEVANVITTGADLHNLTGLSLVCSASIDKELAPFNKMADVGVYLKHISVAHMMKICQLMFMLYAFA